jgi:uncharacterized membrane protein YdjX (TVP38/TMEM64 family)
LIAKDELPATDRSRFSMRRLIPLAVIAAVSAAILAMGWHRQLSFETLAHHHALLRELIDAHMPTAVAVYVGLYAAAITLSIPVGVFFTLAGGILFGGLVGGAAALLAASTGAIGIFLIARSAVGEHLVRRAGPVAEKLAKGFRADAFSYILFLRLALVFPFWLVNLVPALLGVRLLSFAAATVLGIAPATFVFAFVGAGLESVITAQQAAYHACVAAGRTDCRLEFHIGAAVTPESVAALAALAGLAVVPFVVKRVRGRMSEEGARKAQGNIDAST